MQEIKWWLILSYWVWLGYRNFISCKPKFDWRLNIQTLINLLVILALILEEVDFGVI